MPCTPPPGGVDAEQRYQPFTAYGVRIEPRDGPREELPSVVRTADHVAAHVVRVAPFQCGRAVTCAREDARSRKPGAKRSTWASIRVGHVHRGPVGNVAVRPRDVLSRRARAGSKRVGWARSTNGVSGCSPRTAARSDADDLVERGAQVHGRRASAVGRAPRNGAVERPVELERARPVAVPSECAAVSGGEPIARDRTSGAGTDVEEHAARRGEVRRRRHPVRRDDFAAERSQVSGQRLRDGLCATAR